MLSGIFVTIYTVRKNKETKSSVCETCSCTYMHAPCRYGKLFMWKHFQLAYICVFVKMATEVTLILISGYIPSVLLFMLYFTAW